MVEAMVAGAEVYMVGGANSAGRAAVARMAGFAGWSAAIRSRRHVAAHDVDPATSNIRCAPQGRCPWRCQLQAGLADCVQTTERALSESAQCYRRSAERAGGSVVTAIWFPRGQSQISA
jgi:hypothetical protein